MELSNVQLKNIRQFNVNTSAKKEDASVVYRKEIR